MRTNVIEAKTWPNKWSGDEPIGDAMLPVIGRDGSVQPLIFGE